MPATVTRVLEKPESGSGAQVGVRRKAERPSCKAVVRPFECVQVTRVSGWCRAHIEHERADEHFPTFVAYRRWTGQERPAREGAGGRKTSAWPKETLPEGGVSLGGRMTMDRTRVAFGPSVVLLRYAYELGCCYFLNLAACVQGMAGTQSFLMKGGMVLHAGPVKKCPACAGV